MDEQFSQAYKDFMRSDEAQVLQKHLDIHFGTAILAPVMGHDVIVFVTEVEHDPSAACDFYAIFEGSGTPNAFLREDVTVLPSLSQLLGVIEGAGWEWRKFAGLVYGWPIDPNAKINAEYPVSFDDKDLMLAAAKLAARAVEEVTDG